MPKELEPLYHFYRWGDRAKLALREHLLYYSSPHEWNDPFDGRVHCRWPHDPRKRAALMARLICRDRDFDGTFAEALRMSNDLLGSKGRDAGEFFCRQTSQHTVNAIRRVGAMFCLTAAKEAYKDVLMWSHYADSHRGICVEFSVPASSPAEWEHIVPRQVTYATDVPCLDMPASDFTIDEEEVFLTKAPHWQHELEYRFIKSGGDPGFYAVPPDCVTGVYCGCQMSESSLQELKSILACREHKPRTILRATQEERSYRLRFEPVTPERRSWPTLKEGKGQG